MSTEELILEASNPQTTPARLQELVALDSGTWVHVAKNPNAYPALLDWLGQQGGADVKAALAERLAPQVPVAPPAPPAAPPAAAPVAAYSAPAAVPVPQAGAPVAPQYAPSAPKSGGSKTGLIIVGVIAALALIAAGVWFFFFKDGGMVAGGPTWDDFCKLSNLTSEEELLRNAPNEIRGDLELMLTGEGMTSLEDLGKYLEALANVSAKTVEHCGEDFLQGF